MQSDLKIPKNPFNSLNEWRKLLFNDREFWVCRVENLKWLKLNFQFLKSFKTYPNWILLISQKPTSETHKTEERKENATIRKIKNSIT